MDTNPLNELVEGILAIYHFLAEFDSSNWIIGA